MMNKRNIATSPCELCVDHEESSGTKQRLRKYTTHSEPPIELSNQSKHKEHVYFYFNFKLNGSTK